MKRVVAHEMDAKLKSVQLSALMQFFQVIVTALMIASYYCMPLGRVI